jgi:hypothetical protein
MPVERRLDLVEIARVIGAIQPTCRDRRTVIHAILVENPCAPLQR